MRSSVSDTTLRYVALLCAVEAQHDRLAHGRVATGLEVGELGLARLDHLDARRSASRRRASTPRSRARIGGDRGELLCGQRIQRMIAWFCDGLAHRYILGQGIPSREDPRNPRSSSSVSGPVSGVSEKPSQALRRCGVIGVEFDA